MCECWNTLSEPNAKSAPVPSRSSGGRQEQRVGSKTPSSARLAPSWKTLVKHVCLIWSMDCQSNLGINCWMTRKSIFLLILHVEIILLISLIRMYWFIYSSSIQCNYLMNPSKIILFCKNLKEIILVYINLFIGQYNRNKAYICSFFVKG